MTPNAALNLDGPDEACPACNKISALCICATIEPFDNRISLLILQHPQEQDRELGTARLTQLHFRDSNLKVGLSWPNLTKAVGRPAEPRRWGSLYLGPAEAKPEPATQSQANSNPVESDRQPRSPISVVDRHNKRLDEAAASQALSSLEGIILLDGSWSQAKTLWWRNAWLLKTTRIVLTPTRPSLYGRLRKEPRRESISTLEASAMIMARLEGNAEIETRMLANFQHLLRNYQAMKSGRP